MCLKKHLAILTACLIILGGCSTENRNPIKPDEAGTLTIDGFTQSVEKTTIEKGLIVPKPACKDKVVKEIPCIILSSKGLSKSATLPFNYNLHFLAVYASDSPLSIVRLKQKCKYWIDMGYFVSSPSYDHIYCLDLNWRAGGKFVHIVGFFYPTPGTLTNLEFLASYNKTLAYNSNHLYEKVPALPVSGNQTNLDLNQGAGGAFIYGHYTQVPDGRGTIKRFTFILTSYPCSKQDLETMYDGWYSDGTDLNKGAGGWYIYMIWHY